MKLLSLNNLVIRTLPVEGLSALNITSVDCI
jgi:hypothetical protein